MTDIPPRIRLLLGVAALGGLIFISMGSLVGNGLTNVGLDKIVHGAGYGLLGLLIVLALHPKWYIPAFIGVAVAGIALEYAQLHVIKTRSFSWADVVANTTGIFIGFLVGFLLRGIWVWICGEILAIEERKRLIKYDSGAMILSEGETPDYIYVLREGRVKIVRHVDSEEVVLATLGAGEVIGEMGVLSDSPRSASAIATENCLVYRMETKQMIESEQGSEHPVIPIARALAKRLREMNQKLETLSSN